VKRIVDLQTELILATLQKINYTDIEVVFICAWGFDGSTDSINNDIKMHKMQTMKICLQPL